MTVDICLSDENILANVSQQTTERKESNFESPNNTGHSVDYKVELNNIWPASTLF